MHSFLPCIHVAFEGEPEIAEGVLYCYDVGSGIVVLSSADADVQKAEDLSIDADREA